MLCIAHQLLRAVVARIGQGGLQDTVVRDADVASQSAKVRRLRHSRQPADPCADRSPGDTDLSADLCVRDDAALTIPELLDQRP